MIKSNVIAGSILRSNVVGGHVIRHDAVPPAPGEITDAILCEDGSPMLLESGEYFKLENPASVKQLKSE